ncbi:MAG: hypothetical protein FWC47_15285 [Oscillospiraceae bacterium]|nr:hypothetical protein [Oscillospiraceae bacterium]
MNNRILKIIKSVASDIVPIGGNTVSVLFDAFDEEWNNCPISEDLEFTLLFYRFDHDLRKCIAPEYFNGSKDIPKACIDAIMLEENPSECKCSSCGGAYIGIQPKEISVKMTENILRKFLTNLKVSGYFSSVIQPEFEIEGKPLSRGEITIVICIGLISKEMGKRFGKEKSEKWFDWAFRKIVRDFIREV